MDGGRKLPIVDEFYSIQGEGFNTGKPAYFIRIGGCDIGCSCVTFQFTRLYDKIVTEHSKVSICQGTYHSMGFESIACSERNRIINLIK